MADDTGDLTVSLIDDQMFLWEGADIVTLDQVAKLIGRTLSENDDKVEGYKTKIHQLKAEKKALKDEYERMLAEPEPSVGDRKAEKCRMQMLQLKSQSQRLKERCRRAQACSKALNVAMTCGVMIDQEAHKVTFHKHVADEQSSTEVVHKPPNSITKLAHLDAPSIVVLAEDGTDVPQAQCSAQPGQKDMVVIRELPIPTDVVTQLQFFRFVRNIHHSLQAGMCMDLNHRMCKPTKVPTGIQADLFEYVKWAYYLAFGNKTLVQRVLTHAEIEDTQPKDAKNGPRDDPGPHWGEQQGKIYDLLHRLVAHTYNTDRKLYEATRKKVDQHFIHFPIKKGPRPYR